MASSRKKLSEYHRKRTPDATNEPFGDEAPIDAAQKALTGAYVIQLHDATRRHYDVRLETSGVLVSFAVPRGPSLNPADKHLAVKTEDHPIEYLEFEDVIPEKQYGAGPMIVWDRGMATYLEGPLEDEIAAGKIHVELTGMKLRGRWTFVKLKKSAKGDEWLFFKKQDEHADAQRNIVEALPRSILSGLTVEEIERAAEIAAEHEKRALDVGAARLRKRDFTLSPIASGRPDDDDGFVFDPELDGIRVLAIRDGDVVTIRRGDENIETFYPDVVRALRSLPVSRAVFDGELVAFDPAGRPSLPLLASRAARIKKGDTFRATVEIPVSLVATDLLALGDADTRTLPLVKRRELLGRLVPSLGYLKTSEPLEGDLGVVLSSCAALGISGVVAKKKEEPYGRGFVHVSSGIAPRDRIAVDHGAADARSAIRKVAVSNRTKIFWPDEKLTKGDLIDFYAGIADTILPHIANRPVILVRYPDGIDGKSFYQWNVPPGMPAWVRTMSLTDEEGASKRGFLVDDASTLVYIANLGCIPIHILASRFPDLEHSEFFTIDFDIKQSTLANAVTLATTLKELLDTIGLRGFPKTSGQTGLHVLVPLGKGQTFDTARALADLLGQLLVARHPKIATMERVVSKRGPKVYVDTGQTGATRAIVAPYSVRATKDARVSTPLSWDEVEPDLDPGAFTIRTVPARIASIGDPMRPMLDEQPDVARAVAELAEIVRPA